MGLRVELEADCSGVRVSFDEGWGGDQVRAGWCQCWVQHVTVTNASGELSPPAPASAAWPEGPKDASV